MKKTRIIISLFSLILVALLLSFSSLAQEAKSDLSKIELYPGGMHFGARIVTRGLTVVKFSETEGENASCAYLAGMREGDLITKVNEADINTIEDFIKAVDKNGNNVMTITAIRNNKEMTFKLKPKYSSDDGRYKTGIWVKDSTSGIGTVTFITPQTYSFGGLGHAICDSKTGKPIPLSRGQVINVDVNGVIKGKIGTAGELKGSFEAKRIGSLTKNSMAGVFGILTKDAFVPPEEKMHVCPKEQIVEGDAYIWCELDNECPQKYSVQISNIDVSNSSLKNFKVKITDKELLEKSGGIVQGMSGSPIIQNGRIIGAVTHVLINDPTQGYGIFIENMLDSMPSILK